MKIIICLISCFVLTACSDRLSRDRIKFTYLLLENPREIKSIMDTSSYNCDPIIEDRSIMDQNLWFHLKANKYNFWNDKIKRIVHDEIINGRYVVTRVDTVHDIVYKNTREDSGDYITFRYTCINNKWCLDTLLNFDVLGFGGDYYSH